MYMTLNLKETLRKDSLKRMTKSSLVRSRVYMLCHGFIPSTSTSHSELRQLCIFEGWHDFVRGLYNYCYIIIRSKTITISIKLGLKRLFYTETLKTTQFYGVCLRYGVLVSRLFSPDIYGQTTSAATHIASMVKDTSFLTAGRSLVTT